MEQNDFDKFMREGESDGQQPIKVDHEAQIRQAQGF